MDVNRRGSGGRGRIDPAAGGWTVLVCGDRSRGDEGAAVAAVERLPRRLRSGIRIRDCRLLEPDQLVSALLSGPCLVLDTVKCVAPGEMIEVPLTRLLTGDGHAPTSSHALPMPIVVGLAAALGAPLERGAFLGIGGSTACVGEMLSRDVEAGLDAYVAAIIAHLRAPRSRGCPRCRAAGPLAAVGSGT
jgi:hydrogenase maturation protease